MKTYLFSFASMIAAAVLLSIPALAAPAGPIYTNTDTPNLALIEGTNGQTDAEKPSDASPTGAVKNMAPVRGNPGKLESENAKSPDSASGLAVPGASSGSSFGSGSNSTLTPLKKAEGKDLNRAD